MANGLERNHVTLSTDCHSSSGGAYSGNRGDVSGNNHRDCDSISADHHADLLDALSLCAANRPDAVSVVDRTRVEAADCYFTSVRIHPNLGNHQSKWPVGVATHHRLTQF